MMAYGFCYADSGPRCSGGPRPGTVVLRDVVMSKIQGVGSLGIYNCRPKRTSSNLSLHAVGRAWDAAIAVSNKALGVRLAQFFVDAAEDLGIQRVIYWEREWDSRPGQRWWSPYSGPNHHDHAHVELCPHAAQNLTAGEVDVAIRRYWLKEEDDLTPEQDARLTRLEENFNLLVTALITEDPKAAKAATLALGDARGDSLFNLSEAARNYAKAAKENTDGGG